MILDDLTVTNFGLYAGRQRVTLAPLSPERPIILFGGLNGGGKTTLLDAIQLCLFGPHAKTSSRGRLGYSDYLLRCIHDKATDRSAGIQLRFRHTVAGREDCYVVRRLWRQANSKCRETLSVMKNDRLAPTLADNWTTQVEEFLPVNIAHLFLFDGEQIERYASPSDSASLISTAVQNLLGLDVVDQLGKDIRVYERRKIGERLDDTARAKVTAAETELRIRTRQIEGLRQDRAALQANQIDRCRAELTTIEGEFRLLGGDLFEQRQAIERAFTDAEEKLRDSSAALRDLASGALPLVLVRGLLYSAAKRDRRDVEIGHARQIHDLLGTRDEAVLRHLRDHMDDEPHLRLRRFLESDRARYGQQANQKVALRLTQEARNSLSMVVQGQLDELVGAVDDSLASHSEIRGQVERTRALRDSIPEADVLASVIGKRDSVARDLARGETERMAMDREIERMERQKARQEQSLVVLMEAAIRERGVSDDRDRVLQRASKVRMTLRAFRDAMIQRNVSRIENLVLESYHSLLRKTTLVARIGIDPETFSLTLAGRSGMTLRTEELSAGERQLLGIALLWGLARASGRPLPTAIDTPLARLDAGHRTNFVDRYLPFASHQTILFSTDEEIVGDYLRRLRPRIGRTYYLNHDDEAGHTKIVPGYFENGAI